MRSPPTLRSALVLLVMYLALEYVEHFQTMEPHGMVPWDPSTGIGFAALLMGGWRFAPMVLIGEVVGTHLFCPTTIPLWELLLETAVMMVVWGGAAQFLRRRIRTDLSTFRDLFTVVMVAALAALVHSLLQLEELLALGEITVAKLMPVMAASWIGDMVGVMVVTSAILVLRDGIRLPPRAMLLEIAVQTLLVGAILVLNIQRMSEGGLQLFFLLFLPAIWVASRFGLTGAVLINMVMQIGIAFAFVAVVSNVQAITAYQFRMLSLTVSTLFLGAAVTGRRRAEATLRDHLDRQASYARLSTAGEMAAAMAHEINQPLAAVMNYTRATQRLMTQPDCDPQKVRQALDGVAAQAERAGKIIQSLRDFIGRGELDRHPHAITDLVAEAIELTRIDCDRLAVRMEVVNHLVGTMVMVDAIQIQQVLVNLISNAVDALAERAGRRRQIVITLRGGEDGAVEVSVSDSGPGMSDELAARLYQPFNTTKTSGMGLGLSISRTIIEAHGGRLWLAERGRGGCVFRFTLPRAED
ncbi:hypothetical protein A6A04_07475 [Paramagnetospirillum marisnigri]|uniref:histidine kinase n=1 Tax=Paramagnetospirillum marisnigri TaxID=1285242 RepID=A0A178MCD4_9PROT|nr:ATP-binding protein [Paramagnetospirillum marisnigri]OAN45693.1 hypothetical protein A6A04_07345 [Paramagnetospirillum marisnigri]OAN45715.1 hypothetical protein A6A04_07475 [Paramagnetospirillum marisnigri]